MLSYLLVVEVDDGTTCCKYVICVGEVFYHGVFEPAIDASV